MTTRTWSNPGTYGNWGTVTNWTPLGVPASGDDVVIPGITAGGQRVTLDISSTPPLDSVTLRGNLNNNLYIGPNTLNVTGTGSGATDALTIAGSVELGTRIFNGTMSAAGAINAGDIVFQNGGLLQGFGTIALSGHISGPGTIRVEGPPSHGPPPYVGTLSILGTIDAGVRLDFLPLIANDSPTNILEILGTATSSWNIPVYSSLRILEVGPVGSLQSMQLRPSAVQA